MTARPYRSRSRTASVAPRPCRGLERRLRDLTTAQGDPGDAIAHKGEKRLPRLSLRLARGRRSLLEPHQPLQPPDPGLHLRRKVDLGSVTGAEQRLSRPEQGQGLLRISLPERTVNPDAEYADQSDLVPGPARRRRRRGQTPVHRLVRRHGLGHHPRRRDRQVGPRCTTRGRARAWSSRTATPKGRPGSATTSPAPTHDKNTPDLDAQTVTIPWATGCRAATTRAIAGPNPWTLGPLAPQGAGIPQRAVGERSRPQRRRGRQGRSPPRLHRLVLQRRGVRHRPSSRTTTGSTSLDDGSASCRRCSDQPPKARGGRSAR